MRRVAPLVVLVILAMMTSGCTTIFAAHVDDAVVTAGWELNEDKRREDSQFLGIGLKRVTLVYEYDESRFNGPYPAAFLVTSLKILGGASRQELFEELDQTLQDVLENQNVELDQDSRVEGERVLAHGQETIYFTYEATAQGDGSLFDQGREIRILGEVFNDQRSDLTVLLIGLAQVTGDSFLTGQENNTNWEKIVEDPEGTIEGYDGEAGLAYHVISNG